MLGQLRTLFDAAYLQQTWSGSKNFRRFVIAVGIFALLRLLVQLAMVAYPDPDLFPDDLRIYLDAGHNILHQRDLYPPLPLEHMEFYQYPPLFAVFFVPSFLPNEVVALIHTGLHVVVYALLYIRWNRLFRRFNIERGREMLAWTLPIWLLFAAFWNDIAYLNVYLLTALLATLLIEAVLDENLPRSVLWLSVILQIKPQWAFAALVPLLLGRYRFFFNLIVRAGVVYVVLAGITIVVIGPDYGFHQYREYFHLLAGIGDNYPWRGSNEPYLGYNHSIPQTMVYLFGDSAGTLRLALVVRVLLLVPLGVVVLRCLRHPLNRAGGQTPRFALDLALALYTAVFIWLEVMWELSLGIAVFTYLLATLENRRVKLAVWIVFVLYALVDAVQVLSYIFIGDAVIETGPYVLTDISIYIPLIMIVTVFFHALLIWRLWGSYPALPLKSEPAYESQ